MIKYFMAEFNGCKPLLELFKDTSSYQFNLFMYDPNENMIFVMDSDKTNKKLQEEVSKELQIITAKLNSLNCNYSIDVKGNILLNCYDKNFKCDMQ